MSKGLGLPHCKIDATANHGFADCRERDRQLAVAEQPRGEGKKQENKKKRKYAW